MVAHGIRILPLIKNLKVKIHDVTQAWYGNDVVTLGTFSRVGSYFNLLKQFGHGQGYYYEPSKSILIVNKYNIEAGKLICLYHGCKVCTGECYLDGYIRYDETKCDCMKKGTEARKQNIHTISGNEGK